MICTLGALPTSPYAGPATGGGLFASATETPATPDPWSDQGALLLATMASKSKAVSTFGAPLLRLPEKSPLVDAPPADCTPESQTANKMSGSPNVSSAASCRCCHASCTPINCRSH